MISALRRRRIFFTFPDDAVPGRGQDGDGGGAAAGRPRQSQVDVRGERVIVAVGILRSLKGDGHGIKIDPSTEMSRRLW